MREERIEVDGVPGRLYDPGDARGLLLFGHGGGGSKDLDRFVGLAREYAAHTGLAVVCIDAVDHGERRPLVVDGPGVPRRWHSASTPRMVADWQATAAALSHLGPPLAFVGFSMGSVFGLATVAAMPTITAAVFWVVGIPTGDWMDDPPLHDLLVDAAASLGDAHVLLLNATNDELFSSEGTHELYDAIPGDRKQLVFFHGAHDDWSEDDLRRSIEFVNAHT